VIFHLIDRIDLVDVNRSVVARKLTSHREDYWRDDGRGPEMPPPLVFEALCQAGTWLVMTSTDLDKRAALLSVESITFGPPVRPGDVLRLEGTVESMGPETAVLSGRVSVRGRTVLEATAIMCALLPTEELEDVDAVRRMHSRLTRAEHGRAA